MNVVSPSYEHLGDSSGLKTTKMFFHIDHIHAVSLQCGEMVIFKVSFLCEALLTLTDHM